MVVMVAEVAVVVLIVELVVEIILVIVRQCAMMRWHNDTNGSIAT